MESIGQGEGFGYTLYETKIECDENLIASEEKLEVNGFLHSLRGRCHFFAIEGDGNWKSAGQPILLSGPESVTVESVQLTLTDSSPIVFMTENPGRVNFENTQPLDSEHKGLLDKLNLGKVRFTQPEGIKKETKLKTRYYTGGRPFRNTAPFSQHFFNEFVFCLGTPFRNTSLDQKDFRPENWQKWTKMTKTWFSKC